MSIKWLCFTLVFWFIYSKRVFSYWYDRLFNSYLERFLENEIFYFNRIATSRAASGRLFMKENPTLPVASNCNASLPTISCHRYNTRHSGSENITQDLTLSASKKPKCQYKRRWKVASVRTVSLPRRSAKRRRIANRPAAVPANVQPCSSRGMVGDSPSKHASTSLSSETLALPGSSKCSGNFQNAQNLLLLRRRGIFRARRANSLRATEDCGAVLRGSDASGTGGEVGAGAICGLAENACAQQTASAMDDDSAISTQSNLSISHEVPEKRWVRTVRTRCSCVLGRCALSPCV